VFYCSLACIGLRAVKPCKRQKAPHECRVCIHVGRLRSVSALLPRGSMVEELGYPGNPVVWFSILFVIRDFCLLDMFTTGLCLYL